MMLRSLFEQRRVSLVADGKEALAALLHVVFQNIDAVDARYCQNGVAFVIQLGFAIAVLDHPEFAFQDCGEKIARATGRLEKARVNPFSFLFYQIQHGAHNVTWREHLAMIGDPLFRLYLFFHCSLYVISME